MRKLVVDAQLFQTPAWHRGMGKYSMELLKALMERNQKEKVWDSINVIFSSKLDLDPGVLKSLAKIKGLEIVRLACNPNDILDPLPVAAANTRVIDKYIDELRAETINAEVKIDYLILSLMQGEISPVFPSNDDVHKVVLFYDLIPLMLHKIYLQNPITQKEYLSKISELVKAETYLAISKTVANDLAVYLGIDPVRIHSIDGGPIEHSSKSKMFDISHPFILMPTGNDLRKNNRRGIISFEEFNQKHDNKYKLVITSFFKEDELDDLRKLSPNVVFTGNINGEELRYLYEKTAVLLFPSEYEGLGLPILEAVEKNKPVACSDISVFREMSKTAFNYFDPRHTGSIVTALEKAVSKKPDAEEYKSILMKYSWRITAEGAVKAFTSRDSRGDMNIKPHLEVFGVNPSHAYFDAKLLQQSHAELTRKFKISYNLAGNPSGINDTPRVNFLQFVSEVNTLSPNAPVQLQNNAVNLYHISNTAESAQILFVALAVPGVLILHDLDLDVAWKTLVEEGFVDQSRYDAEFTLSSNNAVAGVKFLVSLISRQRALIVFDAPAKATVEKLLTHLGVDVPIYVLSMPSNTLVYPEILPEKEGIITLGKSENLSDGVGTADFDNDFEYEIALSRTKMLYWENSKYSTNIILPTVEAMKYGVVSFSIHSTGSGVSGSYISKANTLNSFLQERQETSGKALRNFAHPSSTYAYFAKGVAKILNELESRTE